MSEATRTSQLDKIRQVLQERCGLEKLESITATPLHGATESGNVDKVRQLMEQGKYDVNCTDSIGWTPLHYACALGNIDMVRMLVSEFRGDTSIQDVDGRTVIMLAALAGHDNVVYALLSEYQCSADTKDNNGVALIHYACGGGNIDIVRSVIEKHSLDINVETNNHNTPLHIAASHGQEEMVLALIKEFGCDPSIKGKNGWSILHHACQNGSATLVRTLIQEHNADVKTEDNDNNTPLHIAAGKCPEEVVLDLLNEFDCDPNMKGFLGRSVLHYACQGGSASLVRTLIREHNADINAKDKYNDPSLIIAAQNGQDEVVLALINEFGCDPNVKGFNDYSVLHYACERGSIGLVRTLIRDHNANVNAKNKFNDTPLHIAARNDREEVALALMSEFGCDPNAKEYRGSPILHTACQRGSASLVRKLISEYNADVNAKDSDNNTPLYVATLNGHEELALVLINKFGCDPSIKGYYGWSILHNACKRGNISLVRTLIREHNADVNAKNNDNYTPLHAAARSGQEEVVSVLINEFGCDPSIKGYKGSSLLHTACLSGSASLVRTLIREYNADVNARDNDNNTPLHTAARTGKKAVVLALINEFGCDPHMKDDKKNSLLHIACQGCNEDLVGVLIEEYKLSPLLVDSKGNTPLHADAADFYNGYCVRTLLELGAPVLIRNKAGKTPVEVATSWNRRLLNEYIRENKDDIYYHYDALARISKKEYSNPQRILRIFVVGNPGVGKSSLIEAMKKESFFDSFQNVSESSVPPHTAGIIPSTHHSKHLGRILFYDFAGDPEYYSSHAAILEQLASLKKGTNIFIIVADLREDDETTKSVMHYWVSFIRHQTLSPFIIFAGSHSDLLTNKDIEHKCKIMHDSIQPKELQNSLFLSLNCCKPRSRGISSLHAEIHNLTKDSPQYELSPEANALLGLLKKDFNDAVVCTFETLRHHIVTTHICLPADYNSLRPFIWELHELGLIMMIERQDSVQIVVNTSLLCNTVHRLLFSEDGRKKILDDSKEFSCIKMGIIPPNVLHKNLPEYVTIESLVQLQYCQKICPKEVGLLPSLSAVESRKPFLFFPALLSMEKSDVLWTTPSTFTKSIGWLAKSKVPFPPNFLHILLLRVAFRFAVVQEQASTLPFPHNYTSHCSMWRRGVYWFMKEGGAECMVELVDGNRSVVVTNKCEQDMEEECMHALSEVVRCVGGVLSDLCPLCEVNFYLLDSTEDSDFLDSNNHFALSAVREFLESKLALLSLTGKKFSEPQKLSHLYKLALWYKFFPLDHATVLKYLQVVASEVMGLGLHLVLSPSTLDKIEEDFPSGCNKRTTEVVKRWMSSTNNPPCWWHLVTALREIEMGALATEIERDHRDHIQLQEKLLTEANKLCRPDSEFLQSFAAVVGRDWQSLATSLQLGESIEKGKDLSPQDHAHRMLQRWASRDDATYGQLCTALKAIPLLHYGT